MGDKAFLV